MIDPKKLRILVFIFIIICILIWSLRKAYAFDVNSLSTIHKIDILYLES